MHSRKKLRDGDSGVKPNQNRLMSFNLHKPRPTVISYDKYDTAMKATCFPRHMLVSELLRNVLEVHMVTPMLCFNAPCG